MPPCRRPTWANRLDNLRLLAGAGLLTQAEARRAEGLLPEAVAARGDGPAVLCHGELFPGHIFVAADEDEAVTRDRADRLRRRVRRPPAG